LGFGIWDSNLELTRESRESVLSNPESRGSNLEPRTPNPESRDSDPRIPNPESQQVS